MNEQTPECRKPTADERRHINALINQFSAAVCAIPGIRAHEFHFHGASADIGRLRFLFCEGVELTLSGETIDAAGRLILGEVLVRSHGFHWCIVDRESKLTAYAVCHERLNAPFVLNDLVESVSLPSDDGDQPDISDYVSAAYEKLVYQAEWTIPPPPGI